MRIPLPHPSHAHRLARRGWRSNHLTGLVYIAAGLFVFAVWLAFRVVYALAVAVYVFVIVLGGGRVSREVRETRPAPRSRKRQPAGKSGRPVFTSGRMPNGALPKHPPY